MLKFFIVPNENHIQKEHKGKVEKTYYESIGTERPMSPLIRREVRPLLLLISIVNETGHVTLVL